MGDKFQYCGKVKYLEPFDMFNTLKSLAQNPDNRRKTPACNPPPLKQPNPPSKKHSNPQKQQPRHNRSETKREKAKHTNNTQQNTQNKTHPSTPPLGRLPLATPRDASSSACPQHQPPLQLPLQNALQLAPKPPLQLAQRRPLRLAPMLVPRRHGRSDPSENARN